MRILTLLLSAYFLSNQVWGESRLRLEDQHHPRSQSTIRVGTYRVAENRATPDGRQIHLRVVVLPARGANAQPDPVFILAGGPGLDVTQQVEQWARHWMRNQRDIVLISQRGTGGDNRLACPGIDSDADPQSYLEPLFDADAFRACHDALRKRFDLTQYSTPVAMDDINDVRAALGYQQINLYGGSYGSRAELWYIRRHPEAVRCAILNSVAPIAFRNPLHHSRGAQQALDLLLDGIEQHAAATAVFGDLRKRFAETLAKLDQAPAVATVRHPEHGGPIKVKMSREAFTDILRLYMYTNVRDVPRLIVAAHDGDFDELAQHALERGRALRRALAFGMLLCVTCAEDVARITPDDVVAWTHDTFAGPGRVERQMAVCAFWSQSKLPDDFDQPVVSDRPVLMLSGRWDPVTPPSFAEAAVKHLSAGQHVVLPGTHGVSGPCPDALMQAFLKNPAAKLDVSCVQQVPPLAFTKPRSN